MRNLYLVRHGSVEFPGGMRRCIGRTDLHLSDQGRAQAQNLGKYFAKKEREFYVYTSPLSRAVETAEYISAGQFPVFEEPGLIELDMGEWENVPMKDINKTLESVPVHGETRNHGLCRFESAIQRILAETERDVICVAHAGVNCCFLASVLNKQLDTSRALPQPYGGFSRIIVCENKPVSENKLCVEELGCMPQEIPDDAVCLAMWDHYHTPDKIRIHCQAVCRKADELAAKLLKGGSRLNTALVHSAALLHDIARAEPDHALTGSSWIRREGYPRVAEIVRQHHDLAFRITEQTKELEYDQLETAVVYLADKYINGTLSVTLEERFEASRRRLEAKGAADEAFSAHSRRFCEAKAIEHMLKQRG